MNPLSPSFLTRLMHNKGLVTICIHILIPLKETSKWNPRKWIPCTHMYCVLCTYVCLCIYIGIDTCTNMCHICIHTHTYIWISYTHMWTHTHMHTWYNTLSNGLVDCRNMIHFGSIAHIRYWHHSFIHTYIITCMHACMHACTLTHTCTYIYKS